MLQTETRILVAFRSYVSLNLKKKSLNVIYFDFAKVGSGAHSSTSACSLEYTRKKEVFFLCL